MLRLTKNIRHHQRFRSMKPFSRRRTPKQDGSAASLLYRRTALQTTSV